MPVHYLYGGSTASYAVYGQSDFVTVDPSEAWAEGTKVSTEFLCTFTLVNIIVEDVLTLCQQLCEM